MKFKEKTDRLSKESNNSPLLLDKPNCILKGRKFC